ncbi:hypothetical protein FQA39_LY07396 [Lamprigera yunnana]|nr:hypothetical protein FQA39_LY07396 [Lamprigera yunnana]
MLSEALIYIFVSFLVLSLINYREKSKNSKNNILVQSDLSCDINDFVNVDLNLATSDVPNENDILQSVHSKHVDNESSDGKEDENVTTDCITLEQAEIALNLLTNFIETSSGKFQCSI